MPEFLAKSTKQLNEFWNGMDRPKRRKLIILVSLLVVLALALVILLGRKEYVTLYSGLDAADAGEIINELQEMGIDAKPAGDDTILVNKDQEAGVRMQLAAKGYPKSGLNYDLFTEGISFGTTDFEKQKYLQFQLQDRLQQAIRTLNGVSNAIVTISLPEEDSFVFQADRHPAAASVVLELEKGYKLNSGQVKAIEELLSKSISGLESENISIIDSNMNLLNDKKNSESEIADSRLELQNQVAQRLQQQVISLLEPIFGYNRVLAAVSVRLDFDKKITESIRFEPAVGDEGLVVSMSELKEKVVNGKGTGGVPGQDSNGEVITYPSADNEDSTYEKINNTINYELNQIQEQLEQAQGQIKDLSVSVVIDSADLSADIRGRIQGIVAGAVGIEPGRVVVDNMKFQSSDDMKDQLGEALDMVKRSNMLELIERLLVYGMIGLFALILTFMIYRLIREGIRSRRIETAKNIIESASFAEPGARTENEEDEQSNAYREVMDMIKQKPEEVAQLIRTWIMEDTIERWNSNGFDA